MATKPVSLSFSFGSSTLDISSSNSSSSSSLISSSSLSSSSSSLSSYSSTKKNPVQEVRFHKNSSRRDSAPSIMVVPEIVVNSITSGIAASASTGTPSSLRQKNLKVPSESFLTVPSTLFSKKVTSTSSSE